MSLSVPLCSIDSSHPELDNRVKVGRLKPGNVAVEQRGTRSRSVEEELRRVRPCLTKDICSLRLIKVQPFTDLVQILNFPVIRKR